MTDMRDELLERIVGELRALPPVDEAAIRRIVTAASEDENAVGGARSEVRGGARWWRSRVPLAAAAGLALAAGLAGYAVGGGGPAAVGVSTAAARPESLTLVSADHAPTHPPSASTRADRTIPTQFILEAPRASRVALVGDFNAWDLNETPLVRDRSSGIWTVTVRLASGRHTYAFMVDGRTWTLDPRAPTAQDLEFGTPSSVVLVGTP